MRKAKAPRAWPQAFECSVRQVYVGITDTPHSCCALHTACPALAFFGAFPRGRAHSRAVPTQPLSRSFFFTPTQPWSLDTPKCGLLRLLCLRCGAASASSQMTWCNAHVKFGLVCLAIMPENAKAASKQARQAPCVSDVGTEIDSEHFYGHDHEAKGPRGLALASWRPAEQKAPKPSRPHPSAVLSPRCGS